MAFAEILSSSAPPAFPQSVPRGARFRGFLVHAFATACQVARPPVRIRLERPATGGFYFPAFNGSVSLPVAGYDYNSDWTPLLAGLSPAGMAASLAAPEPYVPQFPHTACMGLSLSRVHHAIFVVLCYSILLFDPRCEHSSVPTAYDCRRRAQRRSRTALLQRRRRLVLDGREHGGRLP